MSADTTIGAVEQSIGGLPHAIAGLESGIASIFHAAAGIGEDALSALGLKHALGVVQHVETGATTTLHQIVSTVENAAPEAQAVSQIALTRKNIIHRPREAAAACVNQRYPLLRSSNG
jgi:prophage DNA circulation protein